MARVRVGLDTKPVFFFVSSYVSIIFETKIVQAMLFTTSKIKFSFRNSPDLSKLLFCY